MVAYGSGHVRKFHRDTGTIQVEMAAHAKWINALDLSDDNETVILLQFFYSQFFIIIIIIILFFHTLLLLNLLITPIFSQNK